MAIYKAVDDFYAESVTLGKILFPMAGKLRAATAEARFLFPKEIEAHLDLLHKKAIRAAILHERLYPASGEHGLPVGDTRSQTAEEEGQLLLEIQDRLWNESKSLFRKYLTLA